MEGNPAAAPGAGFPAENYQTLGRKTLAIFVLQRIAAAVVLLLVSVALFTLETQRFVATVPIPHFAAYLDLAAWACLALFGIFFLLGFFIAWLTYTSYRFALSTDSLKIKRGVLNKEEIAIPYRQIQDVDINRDVSYQMMGLSRIVILTAGHEDEPKGPEGGESEGILPALDKDLAAWLQSELLRRANVQKVVEEK